MLNTLINPDQTTSKASVALTKRERQVLRMKGEGLSSAEVADRLFVAKRTVDFHLANIYTKLQVNNLMQACNKARQLNLL